MGKIRKRIRYVYSQFFPKRKDLYVLNDSNIESCKFFGFPNKHVFFGYYDLPQINADGSRVLVHSAGRYADPAVDRAQIGYFDLTDGKYHDAGLTAAWCWQQGSRLRWHPQDINTVLYNDVSEGGYITKAVSLDTGEAHIISPALYDISSDFRHGVSVNFARLQRLRPGYGYSILPDLTEGNPAPEDDGVFLVDLRDNSIRLVVSLFELSRRFDENLKYEHYTNHVSFCPDGTKFIFFHIAKTGDRGLGRIIMLYLYNIETGTLELLEDDWGTSHYTWRSADELLTTGFKGGETRYAVYDLSAGLRRAIEHTGLKEDGHPSFFDGKSMFVTDTYPNRDGYQKLFTFDMAEGKSMYLAEFYHKVPKSGDMRCDLHPRLREKDGKRIITLDTTCSGLRQVALLEMKS